MPDFTVAIKLPSVDTHVAVVASNRDQALLKCALDCVEADSATPGDTLDGDTLDGKDVSPDSVLAAMKASGSRFYGGGVMRFPFRSSCRIVIRGLSSPIEIDARPAVVLTLPQRRVQ